MAAWATDLQSGMKGFVLGYERRHGPLPDDARSRWLANDSAALAACVAAMIIETPVMLLVGTKEPFADQAREAAGLLPRGA